MSRRSRPSARGPLVLLVGTLVASVSLSSVSLSVDAEPSASAPVDTRDPLTSAAPLVAGEVAASPDAAASPAPDASPVSSPTDSLAPVEAAYEPDFRVGDWELQSVPWKRRWLNGTRPVPPRTVGDQDDKGVPMRALGPGGTLIYNPTVLAQQGLKRLDAYRLTGKAVHRRVARNIARALDRTSSGDGARRWQPHTYAHGAHDRGWVNSNSHGLALSFLSRYYRIFGAEQKLEEATRLLTAFDRRETNRRWFATVTRGGLIWFEHWPDGNHLHTLNAHLNALFGLYDYWLETGSPVAEAYLLGGAQTIREKLTRFRRKDRLSRYSLSGDLASIHYHHTHIAQLRLLSRITGDRWFSRQADKLARDEAVWRANGRGRG